MCHVMPFLQIICIHIFLASSPSILECCSGMLLLCCPLNSRVWTLQTTEVK